MPNLARRRDPRSRRWDSFCPVTRIDCPAPGAPYEASSSRLCMLLAQLIDHSVVGGPVRGARGGEHPPSRGSRGQWRPPLPSEQLKLAPWWWRPAVPTSVPARRRGISPARRRAAIRREYSIQQRPSVRSCRRAPTGCQLAEELHQSGKVFLACGRCVIPRRSRAMTPRGDGRIGLYDRTPDKLPSPAARLSVPAGDGP